jgi:tetratricopeptide (TPR) repeat protein
MGAPMLKRQGTNFICSLLACVTMAAAGFFSPAVAADPDYLVEYKLHSEAMTKGDRAAAAEHGKAAWEAAEAALGDDKLTATLAFNYGRLIALADPVTALAPLRRVQELLDAGIADLPQSEVRAYLAYADYIAGNAPHARKVAKELQEALLALEVETGGPAGEDIVMWLELAKGELAKKRYKRTVEAAAKAEAALTLLAPDNVDKMGVALLLQGIGTLVPYPRTVKDVVAATNHFEHVFQLYPPQKNVETFDVTFAYSIAWHAASHAAFLSLRNKRKGKSEREDSEEKPLIYFESARNRPDDCGIEWERRKPPRYPGLSLFQGYIGAVMVVFDLSDDLIVHNPQILAEVPADAFSKAVLKSMKAWRLKSPPIDHPDCRKNIMTQFTFVIDD